MRKFTIKLMTLLAISLLMPNNANAQSKRTLESEDYETSTNSDWTSPNGIVSLITGDETFGKYSKMQVSGSGNRSAYKSVAYDYELSGCTAADMQTSGYVIEFDALLRAGQQKDRSVSQFILPTTGPNLATNNTYTGSDYIFALSQPTNTTGSMSKTWYINDLTNTTGTTVELNEAWYHYVITVTKSGVSYLIKSGEETIANGTLEKTFEELPAITGFFTLLGRTYGYVNFDNLEIYDYTNNLVVEAPTINLKAVDGSKRTYTIEYKEGYVLYYKIPGSDEYKTIETGTSYDVEVSQSGTLTAYTMISEVKSTEVSVEVDASEITLNSPVIKLNTLIANNNMYYPQISVSCDNSNILLSPTATLTYYVDEDEIDIEGSTYTFTKPASLTVVASAAGYTSSEATFEVTSGYVLSKTIDFQSLTADDFDPATWVSATGVPRDYWTNRAAQIPADVTYYKLTDTSAGFANVLDGITIVGTNRAPEVYIGYGLLTPYTPLSGSNNYMNFIVNGATAEQYVIYEGWNNYGNGTFSTIQAGDAQFGLYRYDTMLKNIKIYSPAVSTTISEAGFATFSSTYAVDFSESGLTAYTATVSDNKVVMTPIENGIVPANTGVILKGAAGNYTGVITTTEAVIENNDLVAATKEIAPLATETTVDEVTYKNYILNVVDETPGFYQANDKKVAAGKAYLQVPAETVTGAKTLTIVWNDGETTGIEENYEFGTMNSDAATFDLSGRKVANPAKGMYIKNGKKFIVK